MLKVFMRNADSANGKCIGEFPPDQIQHIIDLAKQSSLHDGELTGEFHSIQFVTAADEHERLGYFEIVFDEA